MAVQKAIKCHTSDPLDIFRWNTGSSNCNGASKVTCASWNTLKLVVAGFPSILTLPKWNRTVINLLVMQFRCDMVDWTPCEIAWTAWWFERRPARLILRDSLSKWVTNLSPSPIQMERKCRNTDTKGKYNCQSWKATATNQSVKATSASALRHQPWLKQNGNKPRIYDAYTSITIESNTHAISPSHTHTPLPLSVQRHVSTWKKNICSPPPMNYLLCLQGRRK